MPQLAIGETFAQYEIRSFLGSGGMADVYLAEDTRLHRPVALKVLRREQGSAEAMDRFVAEARAASALNHPNVAHIYDIGRAGDADYIAMEFVEGETLEDRLARGPLPIADVIELAAQIADALGDANLRGIVHRDLKPANIVVNQRGQAKVLDFGIAKRLRAFSETDDTETAPDTILGTVPYMSPEQTQGRPLDHRSDLFSFGVILYEMVTGLRPFDGTNVFDTLRRIREMPAPPIVRPDAPERLRRVIGRCMEKERDRRYRTANELLADLRSPQTGEIQRQPRKGMWPWIAIAALLVVVSAAALFFATRDRKPPPTVRTAPRLTKITSAPGLEDEPALSPDGNSIAYASDERGNLDIFVRPLIGGDGVRITDDPADDAQPAWSPDGSRLAFVSARERTGRLSIVLGQALGNFVNAQGGDLFVVSAKGGTPVRLMENAFYPAWSPDGKWIAFQSGRGGTRDIWRVAATGGAPVQITRDVDFDYQPAWSPDGRWIVYGSGEPGSYAPYRLKMVSAAGGTPRVLTDGRDNMLLRPVFASGGEVLLYTSRRGGSLNLWRMPLSSRMEPAGPPEQYTVGEGDDVNPATDARGTRIVYASVRQTPDLWTLNLATGKAEQLSFETGHEEFPHRTRDGVIAFTSDRGGSEAVWLRDARGGFTQFVAMPGAGQARWSPDEKRLAYRFSEGTRTCIAIRNIDKSGLRVIARDAEAPAWSPDGKWIAFTSWATNRKSQIYITSADSPGNPQQITALDLTTSYPTWSPDGKSLSFQATRDDGTRHVWIVDVATRQTRPLTSGASEDSHPFWSPVDPDKILFVRNHENLMTVSVSNGRVDAITNYSEPNLVLDYPSWSRDGANLDFSLARKRGDLYLLQ